MPVRPVLDDLELQLVQEIEADEHQVRAQHAVPALEGDFLQALGRRAARIALTGILTADETQDGVAVGEKLKKLRDKFRAAQPVPFAADIATATKIDSVLIEEMSVRELAGKPERFEYAFALREYIPAPPPHEEPPPPPPPALETTLIVEVIVEGQPNFDFATVTVTVQGNQDDGTALDRTLTSRGNNVWTEVDFPPGSYTARAVVTDPPPMSGSQLAEVREGQKTKVTIVLRANSVRGVAQAYVVHYWFDKAFIEPCLRPVLREVAQRAAGGTERLLIVGHTDLVGGDDYNQALSERRARGVHAYLTFGNDRDAAVAEWTELRKTRAPGTVTTLNDSWGAREYQYMLQDLGFYVGPINEQHDDNTDAAVRAFQASKGLAVDGIVGDDTWPALIHDYLAQDNLSVPDSSFLPNARDGCDGGPLLWLGCGEKDPVRNTQNAWRPNRRTEMLFVTVTSMPPCDIARPVTFDIRPDGSSPGQWCLGTSGTPCCFLTRTSEQPDKLLVQPAHPDKVSVSGQILFEDGTPFANQRYALLAPDGEYLHTGADGKADDRGERPSGPDRGRPVFLRTDGEGRYAHPEPTPAGVYILELPDVDAPAAARWEEDPPETARGNVICKEFLGEPAAGSARTKEPKPTKKADARVGKGGPKGPVVKPHIAPTRNFAVVEKTYTSPARTAVTLKVDSPFAGTATFEASPADRIQFFKVAVGGAAVKFDGTDNSFAAAALTSAAGVQIFAKAVKASDKLGDVTLTLTLNPTPPPPIGPPPPASGSPATAQMTAVELTLDVFHTPKKSGTAPDPFPQPPFPAPAPAATDKWFGSRMVHLQDGNRHRALLVVNKKPVAFDADLVLRNVKVSGATITGAGTSLELFAAASGGASLGNSTEFKATDVPAAGRRFFAQGKTVSGGLRDTGFQLGVKGVEDDGDRVALTVYTVDRITAHLRSTPCLRDGSHAEDMADQSSISDRHDFASSITLVRDCGDLQLTAAATPAAVPITWDIARAADDAAALKALSLPPHFADPAAPANDKRRRVTVNGTGSFHIFAFVDSNGTGKRVDEDDGLTLNTNMVRIEILPGVANNRVISTSAHYNNARSNAGSLVVDSGVAGGVPGTNTLYGDGSFAGHAIAMKVTVRLTGGGATRRRGSTRVHLGYIHVMDADNFQGTYADGRRLREVFTVDPAAPDPIVGPDPVTGAPFPLLAFPVRDHRGAGRAGAATFINSSSDADSTDVPTGTQTRVVRYIDSPAVIVAMTHPVTVSALASISGTNDFIAFLVAFSDDYDENFTTIAQAAWQARFGTFAAGPGWTTAAATTTAPAAMTPAGPTTGEATGRLERCPPGATDNLKMDAT